MGANEEIKQAKNHSYDDPASLVFALGELEGFYLNDIDHSMNLTVDERKRVVDAWCKSLTDFTEKEKDTTIYALVNEAVHQVRNKRSKKSLGLVIDDLLDYLNI